MHKIVTTGVILNSLLILYMREGGKISGENKIFLMFGY